MRITIEPDLPGDAIQPEVLEHVEAILLAAREKSNIVRPNHGRQGVFPVVKVVGEGLPGVRLACYEIGEAALQEMLKSSVMHLDKAP